MTGGTGALAENIAVTQRTAADPAASVWVAANAGSGKTTVLVDRVVRLMLEGSPLSRILCLTFTKAAAAEMENRLFAKLANWTTLSDGELEEEIRGETGKPVSPDQLIEARRLFARALDTPGGLKIATIHAFCESLISRFPLEANVAPHAAVMDERTAKELMAEARDRVLASLSDAGNGEAAAALARLVVKIDEAGFDALMAELTGARAGVNSFVEASGGIGAATRAQRRALGLGEKESRGSILAAACADTAFDVPGLRAAAAALERGSESDHESAATIAAFIANADSRTDALCGDYLRLFLTKSGEPRKKLASKGAADAATEAILRAEQSRLVALYERLKAADVAESSADLLHLAVEILGAYAHEKSVRALLDYDDLIAKARHLLAKQGGVSWVLYKLDGGIDHILIDEAQDTSPDQWSIVEALVQEFFAGKGAREELPVARTLFVVGDEKQSIFSFQGADIAAFERMHSRFKEKVTAARAIFREVPLEFSFRSVRPILEAVDRVFNRPPARDGVIPAGHFIEHRAIREGQAGLVEIWDTEKPKDDAEPLPWDAPLDQMPADSPPARLAEKIARTVKGWLDDKELLPARARAIAPQDILILVRRRGPFFDEMVRALKVANVPVAGTDRMILTEQLAVMDLMALGEFLLLPEDDLTLATVLKGPLFSLTDDDLYFLARDRDGTLWHALRTRGAENPRWRTASDELTALLARADFVSPFEFYAELLGERFGRRRMLARLGPEANDPIDEFLSQALTFAREHPPSLQGFLDWLSRAPVEVKRDLEIARREVRVMTVHGAKGLEAPIVFLPDTCAVPDHRQNARVLRPDGDRPLLYPGGAEKEESVCASARAAEKRRRDEEYRRLLYVAMTRAGDRLYVCGYDGKKPRAADCWYELARDALAGEMTELTLSDGTKAWRLANDQTAPPKPDRQSEMEEIAGELPAWARNAPRPEPTAAVPLAPSRPPVEEPPALSPLAGGEEGLAIRRGRIIHRLLELLPALEPDAREAAARKFLARPLHGLDAESRDAIVREVLAILEQPGFAPLFAPGSRAEVPLAGRIGNFVVAGQVDRLVVTPGEVLIVDYKTNRPVPANAAEAPPAYLKQMAAYRALLACIFPDRPVRCALLWTVAPLLMPIAGEILDFHAP